MTLPKNFACCAAFLLAVLSSPAAESITNSIGMKLVRIEPGAFTMGQDGPAADYKMVKHPAKFDDADWDEKPAHRVRISQAFHLGVTEVTVGQYRQYDADFRLKEPDDDAVNAVTWEQAVKFCEWLTKKEGKMYRLPTEAEWEYACRAGTTTLFHTGDALPDGFQPWWSDMGYAERYFTGAWPQVYRKGDKAGLRVAQTVANAWGLYDMHGNVSEWCLDWYGPYEAAEQTDAMGRSAGDFRVIRGGHHTSFARMLRSANRAAWLPQTRSNRVGFRVVMGELPPGKMTAPAAPPLNARNVQNEISITMNSPEVPVFIAPKPFVKIAPNSFGPLFSTHNHSPSIVECRNGDLLAVWYSCVDEGGSELCNVASRLRRGANEWEPASPFWDGADINDHGPKIWSDDMHSTLYHLVRGRDENLVRTSTDNGVTWSPPVIMQPVGEFGNQMIRLKDGTLVITNDTRQCSLVFSHDEGKTWGFNDVKQRTSDFRPGSKGFRYPGIHAPIVQLADGRIMAFSRNDKPEDQAKFGFKTPISHSSDLGKSWSYEASEFPAISSVQRAVMIRLSEGGILLCSFTDQWSDWKNRKGMKFKSKKGEFTGYGMFAAVSFDEGKTWPVKRLITPGGKEQPLNMIDKGMCVLSDTMAEPCGYLAAIQTFDGDVQLITSKNHYVFNLAWLRELPDVP